MVRWKKTCKRFVAFFDVMGFKDLSYRSSHRIVLSTMNRLVDGIRQIEDAESNKLVKRRGRPRAPKNWLDFEGVAIRPVVFSDSILLVSSDNSKASANHLVLTAQWLTGYCINSGIPVKAAVALGTMTCDFERSIFCGRPLIDAYLLQDDMQAYGVVLHHSAEGVRLAPRGALPYVKVSTITVPMRSGSVRHSVLDWSLQLKSPTAKNALKSLGRLYKTVSGSSRRYVDNTASCLSQIAQGNDASSKSKKTSAT
jgi:hypothetical protein